jgi:hypothetical protein
MTTDELRAKFESETNKKAVVVNQHTYPTEQYFNWLEQQLVKLFAIPSVRLSLCAVAKEDLEDKLCDYCPLEKKGSYSTPGGIHAGCEGSACDDAYDAYLDELSEGNEA